MEVTGILKHIGNTEKVTDNMNKRIALLETQEQYPQVLQVEFINGKTDLLNDKSVGQTVTIGINLRGRLNPKDDTKAYVSINGWTIK